MSLNEEEKWFVFTENDGCAEAAYWCKTLKEAKKEARERKKRWPEEAEKVYIAEVLFDVTKEG